MKNTHTNIWTNGCFDVIHRGHIESLRFAKSLGDRLVVGVDSDERVKKSKGKARPFNKLEDRMEVLRAIEYVDEVVSFDNDEELRSCVKVVSPRFFVKGSDWKGKQLVGSEFAEELIFFDLKKGYSTTKILNKYGIK